MKRYETELKQLTFDEESRRRITQRLCKTQPRQQRQSFPVRRFVAAVAAAAFCVTSGAAGAISLANHSPAFREFFHITSGSQETMVGASALDLVFEDKNGSGARITVRDVTADGTVLYVLMDFEAPEGTILSERGGSADLADYTLSNSDAEFADPDFHSYLSVDFYSDKTRNLQTLVNTTGGYGFQSLPDKDPTDNCIPLLFSYETACDGFSSEIAYAEIKNFSTLRGYNKTTDSWEDEVLTGMEFDLGFPLGYTTPVYEFEGRRQVSLGGVYPAIIDSLAISPYSLSFDVLISDSEAYDSAYDKHGPWQMYVLLNDGTKVGGTLKNPVAISSLYRDEKTKSQFFRIDHAHVMLENVIDPAKIENICFVGDDEGAIMFVFDPDAFKHPTYWTEVNKNR